MNLSHASQPYRRMRGKDYMVGVVVTVLLVASGMGIQALRQRVAWAKGTVSEFTLHDREATLSKADIEGEAIYMIRRKDGTLLVSLMSRSGAMVIQGADFEIRAETSTNGVLGRYILERGNSVFIDMNGDGEMDMRGNRQLDKNSKDINVRGVWRAMRNGVVNIDGMEYKATWKTEWLLTPVADAPR